MPSLKKIDHAFNVVRSELCELGLLDEGVYLDQIECCQTAWPSGWLGEMGYVYDARVGALKSFMGWEEGVIYIPFNAPTDLHVPGGTLLDTIRHEFGHAWAWLDPELFERSWFVQAFGRDYDDAWAFGQRLYKLFGKHPEEFRASPYYQDFISPYALSAPYEDLAETFMTFLRHRRSLARFRPRKGLYRKLVAVRKAVATARRELGL